MQELGHKQAWCAGFMVRMRFAGWPEDLCLPVRSYLDYVRPVYSGLAWQNYAMDCDRWLHRSRPGTGALQRFPTRVGVGITFNRLLLGHLNIKGL